MKRKAVGDMPGPVVKPGSGSVLPCQALLQAPPQAGAEFR